MREPLADIMKVYNSLEDKDKFSNVILKEKQVYFTIGEDGYSIMINRATTDNWIVLVRVGSDFSTFLQADLLDDILVSLPKVINELTEEAYNSRNLDKAEMQEAINEGGLYEI